MRRPVRQRPGFTLIELLVVISIIAILIALLLPALTAAKRAGKIARCLANARQLAVGAHAYEGDKGELPQYRYDPVTDPFTSPKPDNPNPDEAIRVLRITGYIPVEAMVCPEGGPSGGQEGAFINGSTPNMDYMYWGDMAAPDSPGSKYTELEEESFTWRLDSEGQRILMTDRVHANPADFWAYPNWHGNHEAVAVQVERTDGNGTGLGVFNTIAAHGGTTAFSDAHATWYEPEAWNQEYAKRNLAWVGPDAW